MVPSISLQQRRDSSLMAIMLSILHMCSTRDGIRIAAQTDHQNVSSVVRSKLTNVTNNPNHLLIDCPRGTILSPLQANSDFDQAEIPTNSSIVYSICPDFSRTSQPTRPILQEAILVYSILTKVQYVVANITALPPGQGLLPCPQASVLAKIF